MTEGISGSEQKEKPTNSDVEEDSINLYVKISCSGGYSHVLLKGYLRATEGCN